MKSMETIKLAWFDNGRIYILSNENNTYSRPLEAFPVLMEASAKERENYTIEMRGEALRWRDLDADIHISSFYENVEPEYNNEIAHIFSRFPQLNVSEVARNLGINKSLLSKYIYGIKKPSEQRVLQIKQSLRALGRELVSV